MDKYRGKVRKERFTPEQGRIPPQTPVHERNLLFSFRFVDFNSFALFNFDQPHFGNAHEVNHNYVRQLVGMLATLETWQLKEFRANYRDSVRNHQIDWQRGNLTCPLFPALPPGLQDEVRDECFQFQVSKGEHGRVHGFFLENVFHVVWLDPGHQLDPSKDKARWE